MIDTLDIIDEYSVKCDFIWKTVTFIDAALNISFFFFFFFLKRYKHVMFYDFIYLAKGFRMRSKVRSTVQNSFIPEDLFSVGAFDLAAQMILSAA